MFIQRDPIELLGGMNVYQYAPNPVGWVDPWGLSCTSNAKKLRDNLLLSGAKLPSYKNEAHHIVMSNIKKVSKPADANMIVLRDKMISMGIDINDASNGVFLPSNNKIKSENNLLAYGHKSVHTTAYKQNVYNRLININDPDKFKQELRLIGYELKAGTFNIQSMEIGNAKH